jgi:methionine-rich copper-binding protein CopC
LRPRRRSGLRSHLAACGASPPMKRCLIVLVVGAALLFPAQALAHATLETTTPKYRATVSTSPRSISLGFDQYVKALPGSIQLYSAAQRVRVLRVWNDGRYVKASLPRLPRGPYTVRWHALSGDGHVVSGVFTFGVRARAPAVSDAFGSSGPTRSEDWSAGSTFLLSRCFSAASVFACSSSGGRFHPARKALLRAHRNRRRLDDQHRHRGVHPPCRGRAAASVRTAPLR